MTELACRAQQGTRTPCPCGGRNTARVVVEYDRNGVLGYEGGRFCYVLNAAIDIQIPDGATPVETILYDVHEPDEVIRITFTRRGTPFIPLGKGKQ
jgi:hypothetical protein